MTLRTILPNLPVLPAVLALYYSSLKRTDGMKRKCVFCSHLDDNSRDNSTHASTHYLQTTNTVTVVVVKM